MSPTLDDLKRAYYLTQAPGALMSDSLADLEYKFFSNPPSFDYSKTTDIMNIPNAWTEINRLEKYISPGTYVFNFALTWIFTANNSSALFRFSNDGGTTWGEIYSIDPPVTDGQVPFTYGYPIEWAGGDARIVMQCMKESAVGTLDITFCDIWFDQVPNPTP